MRAFDLSDWSRTRVNFDYDNALWNELLQSADPDDSLGERTLGPRPMPLTRCGHRTGIDAVTWREATLLLSTYQSTHNQRPGAKFRGFALHVLYTGRHLRALVVANIGYEDVERRYME